MLTTRTLLIGVDIIAALSLAGSLFAQTPKPTPVSGKEMFDNYCAVCHGETGKGDGPLADELKKPPTDLRHMARNNGGTYPADRVFKLIDGKEPPTRNSRSHGSVAMPVWGDVFTNVRDFTPKKARIDAIVAHIGKMQVK